MQFPTNTDGERLGCKLFFCLFVKIISRLDFLKPVLLGERADTAVVRHLIPDNMQGTLRETDASDRCWRCEWRG